ncbi:NAD-dependent histone deacetylase sir2 [Gnomoniopsis smithogilvyi]|uniref:NAD-dependent histone deacetylase sir2 n=1 Tax=Gnomoniopsis smithogilvyi TaxID=1191159 RepID=A0A9W8YZH3_9PEZI|nr:NAD-dependent histone deacetylase sir2 [Gnomoniopsis smithogilvyi]
MADHAPKQRNSAKHEGKKPVTAVSEIVEFNEKSVLEDIKDDIQHGVAHPINELEQHVNDLDDSWETESMLADMLEGVAEDEHTNDPNFCSPEEVADLRQQLRVLGPEEFCRRTIDAGTITAKKLLTAFGARPPAFLEGYPDEAYRNLLILAITREMGKRAKLYHYNTVDDAAELLKRSQNIIVLTGAGISTSLGIPDFRSAGTGLYSKLEHLGLNDPQEVFNITVFKEDPSIFFSVARDILPEAERFSPTHAFIAMLQQKGKLLTNYSQNIDNLESKAGITPDKLVQCHGSFATASCIQCGHQVPGEVIFPEIKASRIPYCPRCAVPRRSTQNSRKRKLAADGTSKKYRRPRGDYDSASDSEYDMPSKGGIMKPDITFFGEALPDEFSRRLTGSDRYKTDLVIVIGTSLKVAPVSELVPFLPPHIPQIYISRTPVNHHNFDIDLLGDCDVVVAELCKRAGWDLKHEMIPPDQEITVETVRGWPSRHVFTTYSPSAAASATTAAGSAAESGEDRKALDPTSGNNSAKGTSGNEAVVTTTRSGRRSGRVSPK